MSQLTIAPSQSSAAAQQADSPSGASGSGADFGPILQAASVSPAAVPAPKEAPPQPTGGHSSNGAARDDGVAATPDRAPAKPERRGARGSPAAAQQPQADAAAACAAAAAAVATCADVAPASLQSALGSHESSDPARPSDPARSSDPAHPSDPAIAASCTSVPDASAVAQAVATGAAGAALQSPVTAKASTPADPDRAVATQQRPEASMPQLDRGRSSEAPRASTPTREARITTANEEAGADPQGTLGFASSTPLGSSPLAGQGAPAVAQALSTEIQQAAAKLTTDTPSHAGATSTLAPPVDPASTTATPVGGAFGNVTTYAPEARAAVATPVGQPGFGQEFSERVVVLTRGGVQSAQISLEPAGLGPVGVSIQVHGHDATLVFTAQHEMTRSALEAALPRLREMFAACGMQLSDASVGGRAQSDWSAPEYSPSSSGPSGEGGPDLAGGASAEPAATARTAAALRLVDTYA